VGIATSIPNTIVESTAVSCGGVVIFKSKVLLLYKNHTGKYMGWVMPKGTIEQDESYKQAALREVKEESGVNARVVKYIGKTQYTFQGQSEIVCKTVHWYLMTTNSFLCKPEEYFADVGFYKQHEAYHLLKFHDEKQIMKRAFQEYVREAKNVTKRKFRKNYYKGKNQNPERIKDNEPLTRTEIKSATTRMESRPATGH
jgi:8-oxo-dGTP pyrophosphatase MutT (NUDIX family)